MLHTNRDTHKVVWQSTSGPDLSWDGGMAHIARQADAAGHTTEADCYFEQLRLLCYDLTGLHTTSRTATVMQKCEFFWLGYMV